MKSFCQKYFRKITTPPKNSLDYITLHTLSESGSGFKTFVFEENPNKYKYTLTKQAFDINNVFKFKLSAKEFFRSKNTIRTCASAVKRKNHKKRRQNQSSLVFSVKKN